MDKSSQLTLRQKKLGVLIRDARQTARRSPQDCAHAMGVTKRMLRAYEEGRRAPSLPELENLAYFLSVPIEHFWGRETGSVEAAADLPDPAQLAQLRQRMIGALLRQERSKASLSVKTLSHDTGIPVRRIKAYELGEHPIPLPELEALALSLSARIDTFLDENGPIGQWMWAQRSMKQFMDLPTELQAFVSQPVNRPYLELAVKLSSMSSESLRSVAEGLLDITL